MNKIKQQFKRNAVKIYGKEPATLDEMEWCREAFGPPVKGGNWWRHHGHLYFRDETNYTWFLLRWS